MTNAPLILGLDRQLPTATLPCLTVRRGDGESFLRRFVSLTRSNTDAFTGDRASYEQLLHRVQPADVIELGDTPGQVLMLLTLDAERRDQLRSIAAPRRWPAPHTQPWDAYVTQHSDND